ncbi:GIY-YIG nuclease family protein [Sphingomonas sp. CD22]|uniref:GIY-YIG nuclease family protein n=1 Tax=Sphingomonas sp. CD22 TaxID=3100214 RepID=UPI002AE0992A|nr:GIY-YIG nuclease family protein [Sphingomonas sp. CD22]MEA1086421.1 GIY-YIG nuclease family protein [Sphingomonas sp. CD22]
MAIDFAFRRRAVRSLTSKIGVYVLCDLDKVPIYVGQSTDGIRSRVARHLTSARSDIIANRQIDVWEIAWVLAYPVENKAEITPLEGLLFHHFNVQSPLMNGSIPAAPAKGVEIPQPTQTIQVMSEEEIADKIDPSQRLPRQAGHYTQIVGHFLTVKNSPQVARAMDAHFKRLASYHAELLGLAGDSDPGDE